VAKADIGSKLDLRQMRQFLAIVEAGSMKAAAERLSLTAPALVTSLRLLEESLNVKLFTRSSKGVNLTAAGDALVPVARQLLSVVEYGLQNISLVGDGSSRIVRLAYGGLGVYRVFPDQMQSIEQCYPDIRIILSESITVDMIDQIRLGALDIGVGVLPTVATLTDIETRTLYPLKFEVLLPVSHPLASSGGVWLEELKDERFIVYVKPRLPALRAAFYGMMAGAGIMPFVFQEMTHELSLASFVAGGMGIALIPVGTDDLWGSRLKRLPLRDHQTPYLSTALLRRKYNVSPANEVVWQHLSNVRAAQEQANPPNETD